MREKINTPLSFTAAGGSVRRRCKYLKVTHRLPYPRLIRSFIMGLM
jgi:hypothetical protein